MMSLSEIEAIEQQLSVAKLKVIFKMQRKVPSKALLSNDERLAFAEAGNKTLALTPHQRLQCLASQIPALTVSEDLLLGCINSSLRPDHAGDRVYAAIKINYGSVKKVPLHHLAYVLFNDGGDSKLARMASLNQTVVRLCGNVKCINPEHLFIEKRSIGQDRLDVCHAGTLSKQGSGLTSDSCCSHNPKCLMGLHFDPKNMTTSSQKCDDGELSIGFDDGDKENSVDTSNIDKSSGSNSSSSSTNTSKGDIALAKIAIVKEEDEEEAPTAMELPDDNAMSEGDTKGMIVEVATSLVKADTQPSVEAETSGESRDSQDSFGTNSSVSSSDGAVNSSSASSDDVQKNTSSIVRPLHADQPEEVRRPMKSEPSRRKALGMRRPKPYGRQ